MFVVVFKWMKCQLTNMLEISEMHKTFYKWKVFTNLITTCDITCVYMRICLPSQITGLRKVWYAHL